MSDSREALTFGEFRLDPVSGQLYRGATPVPLAPKAFALLHCLARSPGRLISKNELLDTLWPGVYVTDAVLKTAIRELRRALDDDSHSPRFIQTAHRRGYRFIAETTAAAPEIAAPASSRLVASPVTGLSPVRYARSGAVNIAYQVLGDGPRDIIFVMGWVSHLECFWNEPSFARFLTRLAENGRLILFDKRGTGLSDPVPVSELPSLEQRLDDVRAVMEAVGSERAVLVGVSEGGPMCSLFAATYPQRTEALVMIGSYARRMRDAEYPWGATREERDEFCQSLIEEWGGPVGIEERAPSRAGDPVFRTWWASYLRMGASPGAAVALTRMNAAIDVRAVLPSIRVPTLVLHRTGDRCLRVEEGRYLASRIPGAEFVALHGDDHLPFVGDQDEMLDAIQDFLGRRQEAVTAERVLASVMTLQVDGPLSADYQSDVARARGQIIQRTSNHLIAAFDGPGRAVGCASRLIAAMRQHQPTARAGVHIGECDLSVPAGPVFDMSAALAAVADNGTVRVSRTVVDLVPGSGLRFEEGGPVTTRAGQQQQSSRVVP